MENENKPQEPIGGESGGNGGGNKKNTGQRRLPGVPRAAVVWLVILCVLGALALFKGGSSTRQTVFTQTEFESMLRAGRIISADITDESSRVFVVEGRYYLSDAPAAAKSGDEAKDKKAFLESTGFYRARVLFSESMNDLLSSSKTQVKVAENNSSLWNFLLFGILPVLLLGGVIYFISSRQMRMGGKGAMDFGKSRARMIAPEELNVKFDDIAGADEAKADIAEIVEFLKDPIRFQLLGGQIPKGCLLVGNPGTGKTLLAKAVACEAGVPFFSISGSDFVEMFVGVGASRVRDMFEQARKHTPCLIFIDEIDAVGRSRFSGWGGGHDEREQTLNAMLVEMDGLSSRNGVIVLAATNRPDVLDPALLRPGRFDRQVVMDLPDIKGRRQILAIHAAKIRLADNVDLDVIARNTPGFSGADLANLCNEAALLAARYNQEFVMQKDLEEARDKVCYGSERRSRKINDRERRMVAYHEAGHALIALHNDKCTPVHKVTIIPRGDAYLGATYTLPEEDLYLRSKLEYEAEMAMTMGGRAAEELIFGDITTGASGDIAQLTSMARKMVCIFGMSDKIGPTKVGDFSVHPHLRIDGPQPDQLAPETAREIDLEIRRLVNTAIDTAREVLKTHRDELEKLAETLLEKETLSIEEINVLLGRTPAEPETQQSESEENAQSETASEETPAEQTANNSAEDGTSGNSVQG
ncbi:MAG: ATP-dependent zinc metalloprotease FtsH [Lentisphaeria bacterium]|nr:ATP-dependent zinc metalloprotease FtsH [Lentisphaeria bacterium]